MAETYICNDKTHEKLLFSLNDNRLGNDKNFSFCPICGMPIQDIHNSMTNYSNFASKHRKNHLVKIDVYSMEQKGEKLNYVKNSIASNIQQIKEEFNYAGITGVTSREAYDADIFYDILVELLGINKEAVDLVLKINGNNIKTYNDILEVTTGYKDLSQIDF